MNVTGPKPLIKLIRVTLVSNSEIAPQVYVLSFKRNFTFKAGQVLGLALSANDDARLYSIASGENDDNIDILYNVKPDGKLTPELAKLTTGDHLWISPPFGSYFGDSEPAYWIAAGTGIAPFISMYRSGSGKNKTLIHGSRTLDSFYFSGQLEKDFGSRYVRCCSQQKGKGIIHGRTTDYLENLKDLPHDQKYYLCGSTEMVIECRDILLHKGISFDNIVAEIYF